jgi:outer membrane lipoprotein-sorting protein
MRNVMKWIGGVSALMVALAATGAQAQQPKQPPAPAAGQFATQVTRDPQAGLTLDAQQAEAVKKVSAYFNDLKNMRGNFSQTGGDGKRMRGKFFFKQGGRFRFEYGFGSKLLILSDGTNLAIQDLDIKTDDRVELDRTAFRMLLKKDVDLLRDAKIFDVQEVDDLIILAIADKNPDTAGSIRLFMTKKPALELKEWVTTDAQGLDTRVEISDINKAEELAVDLFKIIAPSLMKN